MKLYFVRHGESYANLSGEYDQSIRGELSPKGRTQADNLVLRLSPLTFDVIIVSPLLRVVQTIGPYLQSYAAAAEVWSELAECRGRKGEDEPPLPEEIRWGDPISLPPELLPFLRLRSDTAGRLLPPGNETYREGCRRAVLAADRIRDLYGGKEVAVLMVGHACNGARVLESLMKIELDGRFQHHNAGITEIEQKANGDFIMRYMNRIPPDPNMPQGDL